MAARHADSREERPALMQYRSENFPICDVHSVTAKSMTTSGLRATEMSAKAIRGDVTYSRRLS